MKFILAAVAIAAATTASVSAARPKLRGPVLMEDMIVSSSKSSSGSSGRSGSSSKSSKDFDEMIVSSSKSSSGSSGRSGSSSKSSKDFEEMIVSSKSSSGGSSSRNSSSSKSSKDFDEMIVSSKSSSGGSSSRNSSSSKSSKDFEGAVVRLATEQHHDATTTHKNLPEFFPDTLTEEQLAYWDENYLEWDDDGVRRNRNPNKKNSSQKRQDQRDRRRAIDNPNRSQAEENRERARKTNQSQKRGNRDVDPYDSGNPDYGRNREAKRFTRCETRRESCNYSGPNSWCYNDCVDDVGSRGATRNRNSNVRQGSDRFCSDQCQFIDAACYDDCRGDGFTMAQCLNDCEENIDDPELRRRIERRANRDDYDDIDGCEARCARKKGNNSVIRGCYIECDNRY